MKRSAAVSSDNVKDAKRQKVAALAYNFDKERDSWLGELTDALGFRIPQITALIYDLCADELVDPTVFDKMIKSVLSPKVLETPFTLHGVIDFNQWQELFCEWVAENATHLTACEYPLVTLKSEKHEFAKWIPALIVFWTVRCAANHYGSYEAQIMIHRDLAYTMYWRRPFERIEKLFCAIGERQHLDKLRFIYRLMLQPLQADSGGNLRLRWHNFLNDVAYDMREAKAALEPAA